ncbi:MAG: acyl-CoA dehydrogenase family protein, partial [Alphaproteobacteria bacterium]
GGHYLNETFFTDARVPVTNRIGEENKGWTYAKFLLGNERSSIAGVGKSKMKVEKIVAAAKGAPGRDGGTLWDDPAFRGRVMQVAVKLAAHETTNLRMLAREAGGEQIGAEASQIKINGTEVEQALNELLVEATGYFAAPYDRDTLRADANIDLVGPEFGRGAMTEHLLKRAASIYGGTNEIQREIIAKRVLGL